MRLLPKHQSESKRVRKPKEDNAEMPVSSTFLYSSRRSEDINKRDRNIVNEVEKRKLNSKSNKFWRKLSLIIILGSMLIFSIYVVSLSTEPNIVISEGSSQNLIKSFNRNDYLISSSKYLNRSIWNRNKITVDSGGLARYLTNTYPELASANVSVSLLSNKPKIVILPAQAYIIISSNNKLYALDKNGKIITQLDYRFNTTETNLPIVIDQSGIKPSINQQILPSEYINFIQTIVVQLAAKSNLITSLNLPSGSNELDASIVGQTYMVKFNLANNDPRKQAGTYLSTIAQLNSQGIKPSKYIDVRVDGRAYYQ